MGTFGRLIVGEERRDRFGWREGKVVVVELTR